MCAAHDSAEVIFALVLTQFPCFTIRSENFGPFIFCFEKSFYFTEPESVQNLEFEHKNALDLRLYKISDKGIILGRLCKKIREE